MFGNRIDKPGGGRRSVRDEMMIRASVMTTTDSTNVDLIDLSKSGAKLRGKDLPATGQEVLLLLGRLEAFGSIVWRDANQCGVNFDVQLSDQAVAIILAERGSSSLRGLDAEQRLAANEWFSGMAR